jgi:alpha-L-arabinofuranosidase
VHNLFAGKIDVIDYDSRLTPFMMPHSTYVAALHDNPGGDVQFVNNLFVAGGDASQYSKALLPLVFDGNVYTKGSTRPVGSKGQKKYGEMNQQAKEQLKYYKEQETTEHNALMKDDYDAAAALSIKDGGIYLEIALDKSWLLQKRKMVTTSTLTKALVPNLPFENVDGSPIKVGTDYSGNKRNLSNPSPGPFEISSTGKQQIRVW